MHPFHKLAAELSKRTKDSDEDDSLDLNIAQSSHAVSVLKDIAGDDPKLILDALNISSNSSFIKKFVNKFRNKNKGISSVETRRAISDIDYSTSYSRKHRK